MARITPTEAGGQNVCAFLDVIAHSEGTDNGRQTTEDDGYDVLVGGGLFTGYADHPRKLVRLAKLKINSTAAGRYQFLARTWDALVKQNNYASFSPMNQDRACIALIRGRRALEAVKAGRFSEAVFLCRKEWASLPGAGYGQREQKMDTLAAIYLKSGGALS